MNDDEIASYHKSHRFDVWSRPGFVRPLNKVTSTVNTNIIESPFIAASDINSLYMVGSTKTIDATQNDVYKWDGTNWIKETGYSSGISNANVLALAYDPSDGRFYNVASDGFVNRFQPGVGQNKDWISGVTVANRTFNFCLSRFGLFLFDGDRLFEVNKSTPALTVRVNDGMGISIRPEPTGNAPARTLAVGTSEGIYYAKNLMEGGQVRAWIFRVDRDASGTYITEPIATLPLGSAITSIAHHLSSLIVATVNADNQVLAIPSGIPIFKTTYFEVNSQSGLSAISSPQGEGALDDTVAWIVAANGPLLYLGGLTSLWVYDAIRGGVHRMYGIGDLTNPESPYQTAAFYSDGGDISSFVLSAYDQDSGGVRTNSFVVTGADDVSTVAGAHVLESNYFDMSLPMELKEINKVEIQREAGDGTSTWRVDIEPDDSGDWTVMLTHSDEDETYASVVPLGSPIIARRFRYRLVYSTTTAGQRIPLRSLMITASSGQLISEWELVLDGSELWSADNELQDEQAFFDAISAVAGTEAYITFVDNMQEQDRETDSASTVRVKVQAAQITKNKPGESVITLILREA